MDTAFPYAVIGLVVAGIAVGLMTVRSAVLNSTWSLSDALSEETSTTVLNPDGSPMRDAQGKPVEAKLMRVSSSRLIALVGLIAILLMYVGFGCVVLRSFASDGTVPEGTGQTATFLLTGLSLFAPYLVNKVSSMFNPMGKA